ncbi:MAG: hypothetical protein U1E05_21340 [Patescibacteria group bacterium]|nr:hypothetical protein [Patescibacteria group bacterium]
MIEFLCPNGHRIRCPDSQAGRAAKCPKCQVRFRVPDPSAAPPSPDAGTAAAPASEPLISFPSGDTLPDDAEGGDSFEFLCPNGHRLHGPARLQGQPGECPTCGVKFRVPTNENLGADDVPKQPIAAGRVAAEEEFEIVLPEADEEETMALSETRAKSLGPAKHPTAELLTRLWQFKLRGATLEIRLVSGETLIPDRFAEKSATSSHALLAALERDGTHTVYLVAWDAVQRVLLRGVKSLPEEFDEAKL